MDVLMDLTIDFSDVITTLLAAAISTIMPYIQNRRPIDFNFDRIVNFIIKKSVCVELIIILTAVIYFGLQQNTGFDEVKGFNIYCYIFCFLSLVLCLMTIRALIKNPVWDKNYRILKKIGYIYATICMQFFLFYINISFLVAIGGQPWELKIIMGLMIVIPITILIIGFLLMTKGNSRYKKAEVEIYYKDNKIPEFVKYSNLKIKDTIIEINNENGRRVINRDVIYEIRYNLK